MNNTSSISDAAIYTDFNGLARLKANVSSTASAEQSQQATKEVAKQFESLFLQMMLKSMREASSIGDSSESDQTKFYMEMFDKQIALDLTNNGNGIGLAEALALDLQGGKDSSNRINVNNEQQHSLLLKQIERPTSVLFNEINNQG